MTPYGVEARLPESDAGLLLCSEGDWRIEGPTAQELGPLQGWLWRQRRPALPVRPLRLGPDRCLLLVNLIVLKG